MTALALFEIAQQLRALADMSLDEDLPPEVIADTLEGLEGDFDSKAVDVAKFVLSLEANAEAVKDAAAKMAKRAVAIEHRAESIRAYLLFQLQSVDKRKIQRADITIARRDNPPAVQLRPTGEIPPEFWVQPPAPPPRIDKTLLKAALKAGREIEGAFLESGERVEIKV